MTDQHHASPLSSIIAALASTVFRGPRFFGLFVFSLVTSFGYVVFPHDRVYSLCRRAFRRIAVLASLGYNVTWLRAIGSSENDDERSRVDVAAACRYDASSDSDSTSDTSEIISDDSGDGRNDVDERTTNPSKIPTKSVESYLNDHHIELRRMMYADDAVTAKETEQPLSRRACFVIGADEKDGYERDASTAIFAQEDEPLLDQTVDEDRFLLFPIKHQDLFDLYKLQVAQFWTAEEINLTKDVHDWKLLTTVEQNFFKRILAFFAPSDGIVGENLITRFYNDIGYTEAKYFYVFQAMMENIHAEVYGLLIKNLIPNEHEQNELFRAFSTTPGIREKVEWAEYWLHSDRLFVERLVAFSVVEGLLFSGSFASIFWLKKKGILPGLTFSNELISRDESLHCDFACHLYAGHVRHRLPQSRVQDMVRGAVDAETIFFAHAFADGPVGEMNRDTMMTYVKFCADRLLTALDCEAIYRVANPFEFMHLISLDGRTNFFERRVGDYRQSMVATSNITDDKIHLPSGQLDLSDNF